MKILDVPQSGSVAGSTSSRNRFGQYRRTRATPVNPSSAKQIAARSLLSDASQAWRGLTGAVRAAWNAYAAVTPRQDSLGQTVYPTGLQRFVGAFAMAFRCGFDLPPAIYTEAPPAPAAIAGITCLTGTPALSVSLAAAPATGVKVLVYASLLASAGVAFMSDYRLIQIFTGNAILDEFDFLAQYTARFGALVENKRIFVRVVLVSEAGGPSGPAEGSEVIVPA